MPFNFFHPKPDAFGAQIFHLELDPIGRSGRTLTTAGSTTFVIPTPYRKAYVRQASAHATSIVVSSGTTVAVVQKVVSGTATPVTLTGALTLESMANKICSKMSPSSSATDANRTIGEGDVLEIAIANTVGVTTQPTDLYFMVELLQLE